MALLGFASAFLVVHGVMAWLSPLQGDDWGVSRGAAGGVVGDAVAALVRSTWGHALVSPIASALLVAGAFVLAMRRLPDPRRGRDVLGVALVSCLLWIALPRAGAMWFHRSYVAAQLYGSAVVVWFLAAFRIRRTLAGRAWPVVMAAAGLVAGLASRQVALMAGVGAAIAVGRTSRSERPRWMLPGLAGAAVGLVIGFARSPWGELGRVLGRLEPNLVALAPLLRAGAPVIAIVGLLWLVTRLRDAAPPPEALAADSPDVPAHAADGGETVAGRDAVVGRGRGAGGSTDAEAPGDARNAASAGATRDEPSKTGAAAAGDDVADGDARNAASAGATRDEPSKAGAAAAGDDVADGDARNAASAGATRDEPSKAGAAAAGDDVADGADVAGEALGWLLAWLGLGVAGLLGPRSSEATLLPAAVALTAAALPLLMGLAGRRWVRAALVVLVIGVHGWVWTRGLARYAEQGEVFRERMAVIAATPRGQVATVRPYPAVLPDFWSVGEDWAELALREALAERWGLAAIELSPRFRQLERSPGLVMALEADGAAAEVVTAAAPPRWPAELSAARRRFAETVARLRVVTGHAVVARLRVTSVELADLGGGRGDRGRRGDGGDASGERAGAEKPGKARPVLAAWTDGAVVVAPEASRTAPDATSHMVISIAPAVAARFDEAWQVGPGGAEAVRCATGRCTVAIERAEPAALVLCDAERCLVVDAWVPRL